MSEADALAYWLGPDKETFVAEEDNAIVGTYFMRPNQAGGGAHVCNCGYITSAAATGRGIARLMCQHSLDHARLRGYRAMQFNFVVSTNERAVRLWKSLGFKTVGTPTARLQTSDARLRGCTGDVSIAVARPSSASLGCGGSSGCFCSCTPSDRTSSIPSSPNCRSSIGTILGSTPDSTVRTPRSASALRIML
jgi:hypothetical protein